MSVARTTLVRLAAGASGAALVLAGCGSPDEEASAPSPSADSPSEAAPTATSTPPEATESEPESPSTPAPTSPADTPEPEDVTVDVVIAGGQVTTASDRVDVAPGDTVSIAIETDAADELHVHGVDATFDLALGSTEIEFDVPTDLAPGLYEVETHDSHLLLFSLVVS